MADNKSKTIPLAHPNTRILIIGAGIGGIMLANLCERAGFKYLVLEKASEFKPLGSAINLSHFSFRFLSQLGIYEDLLKVSKPFGDLIVNTVDLDTGEIKKRGTFHPEPKCEEKYGYPSLMFSRPDLVETLLKRIPKSKILMRKKVLNVKQSEEGVVVHVADGSTYHADIVVGADGCYSPVRQSLFSEVEKRKELPLSDKAPLKYTIDCIVGVTEPLDPKVYPDIAKAVSEFQVLLPKQLKGSVWYMPLSRNRLGWMVNEVISKEKNSVLQFNKSKEENNFKQTEWSTEAADTMCKRFSDHPTPYGTTLKTFIDKTPSQLISKVMLEEKFFETWTDGRVCLIGDACHKVLPFGAVGAVTAIADAVVLANLIYDLKSNSDKDIREMLLTYQKERKRFGKEAVEGSSVGSKLFHSKGFIGDAARFVVLHLIPKQLMEMEVERQCHFRPQCAFLPFEDRGTFKKSKQNYSVRYLMEQGLGGVRQFQEAQISTEEVATV